ncbi:SDR family oxidoreductase [Chloroflexota bacterium]
MPLERPGQPEDIAYTAIFLASEASRFVTGQTIMVSGVHPGLSPFATLWQRSRLQV